MRFIIKLTCCCSKHYNVLQFTQYECGNQAAPDQDCLQYLTASSGNIASFNWDTSSTSVSSSQYHLSDQNYDICIRRASGKCSICFSPYVISTTTGTASSYGLSAGLTFILKISSTSFCHRFQCSGSEECHWISLLRSDHTTCCCRIWRLSRDCQSSTKHRNIGNS